ncbi:phosphotransferase [Streptomyces sp. NPDC051940]|uniref:maltokinase N-terminal cap-like domain-containing protein n=1 Tax=Streptomyces sp. NPDC051940 TaxID=3155675 RepID=UPI00342C7B05
MADSIRNVARTPAPRTPDAPPGPRAAERPPAERGVAPSLVPLLSEWVPRQRWFAGKGRPVTELALASVTELLPYQGAAPGLLHLLIRVEQPGPVTDVYQLLLGLRPAPLPPVLAPWAVGVAGDGPLRGAGVYDALGDPRPTGMLLERLRLPGRLGPLVFSREPGAHIPAGLTSRPLSAEQSNSSVVYGDQLILKLFRRVHPGANPDLELPLALARAGAACVPAPAAWFESTDLADADGGPATLGVLQPFLAGATDGWELAPAAAARGDAFLAEARELGRATAEVHTALARVLPTMVLRRQQIEHLTALMTERLDATAAAVPALLPYRDALAANFARLTALGDAGRTWHAQRIHGDLHLGQALWSPAASRWSVIDFEGEPARPLAERRRPQPPARDVAGMLRSFDYAARSVDAGPDWARRTRDAYCAGYAAAAGADPRREPELLTAYEADKAVYEVLYEARHRPDWLDVPLSAIRRLAAA